MTLNRFSKYAWFLVAYNIVVILWGAFVRASGSGAGCGSHWPLCNGEFVPVNPSIARIIEFTHRGMSGIALLLVLGMVIWAFRAYPRGRVRYGAICSGVFILFEALIGATIVLFGWVGVDQSTTRVISISLHLANTFLLLASLTLTAWWASGGKALDLRSRPLYTASMGLALLGVIIIGMTGAITALGDTLFPASSLAQGLSQDVNPAAHFLVQLRFVHPLVGIVVGMYLLYVTVMFHGKDGTNMRKFSVAMRFLVIGQILAGGINVILLAPTWMQLVHLFLADMVWITLVLYSATVLAAERESTPERSATRNPVQAPANG